MSTPRIRSLSAACALALLPILGFAAPSVSRLTPPSELFASNSSSGPVIARFLPGQRFDLQATVRLDAGATLADFRFLVDGIETRPAANTTSVTMSPTHQST